MATRLFEVHKGSWESGEVEVWKVPYLTETDIDWTKTSYYFSKNGGTVEDIANTFSWFDSNTTLFTSSSTRYQYLVGFGYTDVHLTTDTDVKYYFSQNKYVTISNSYIIAYADGVSIYGFDAWGASSMFNSYIPDQTSGTINIYQYYTYQGTSNVNKLEFYLRSGQADVSEIKKFWSDIEPVEEDDDPYSAGGNSGEGGGTGTFSGTGDSIEFPNLPTLSAVSTGFITLFNPSIAEMQNLATYMWSDVFDIGLYKTLFADPMDCILGCSIVPVAVPNGGTKTVNVGNVSTGISMTVAASQYVEVDCGTLNVEEYWGSYLDYDPYTKAEIYLPYCGTHALQVDDIMGKAVHVKYHVDILSGACCAYVKCGSSVMYSFVGQCSSSIPISANDWTNVVNGALTIAASVGSLIATGGASAPMAVGAAAAVTGTIYGGGIKQNVEKSGSMGGTGGMLAVQTPYLILTRPRQALPKKQNTYTGYPSFITTKLEDLKGYTEIDSIRITGVPATDAELNELESILKSGVIF